MDADPAVWDRTPRSAAARAATQNWSAGCARFWCSAGVALAHGVGRAISWPAACIWPAATRVDPDASAGAAAPPTDIAPATTISVAANKSNSWRDRTIAPSYGDAAPISDGTVASMVLGRGRPSFDDEAPPVLHADQVGIGLVLEVPVSA